MNPALVTTSQHLLERFCRENGLGCEAIPVGSSRTADYLLQVDGHEVVAEVKQLDPNPQDRAAAHALRTGGTALTGGEAGSRLRHLIDKGKKQVAGLARDRCPGLLVIYNNVPECPSYTDPMFLMVAMYGHLTVDYELPPAGTGPPRVSGVRHGAKNKLSPSSNTSLSAICVLQADDGQQVRLTFYHNRFAAIPFPPDWLRTPCVRHHGILTDTRRSVREWTEL
jgi:hypothetical protein